MHNRAWLRAVACASLAACSKPDPPIIYADAAVDPPPLAPVKASRVPADSPLARCRICTDGPATSYAWIFTGEFVDAKCTVPAAHSDVYACDPLPLNEHADVRLIEALPGHTEEFAVVGAELRATDAALFSKKSGRCQPLGHTGVKRAPMKCAGLRACRGEDGALTCTECRFLESGCPVFEGSRLYAAATLDPTGR